MEELNKQVNPHITKLGRLLQNPDLLKREAEKLRKSFEGLESPPHLNRRIVETGRRIFEQRHTFGDKS